MWSDPHTCTAVYIQCCAGWLEPQIALVQMSTGSVQRYDLKTNTLFDEITNNPHMITHTAFCFYKHDRTDAHLIYLWVWCRPPCLLQPKRLWKTSQQSPGFGCEDQPLQRPLLSWHKNSQWQNTEIKLEARKMKNVLWNDANTHMVSMMLPTLCWYARRWRQLRVWNKS